MARSVSEDSPLATCFSAITARGETSAASMWRPPSGHGEPSSPAGGGADAESSRARFRRVRLRREEADVPVLGAAWAALPPPLMTALASARVSGGRPARQRRASAATRVSLPEVGGPLARMAARRRRCVRCAHNRASQRVSGRCSRRAATHWADSSVAGLSFCAPAVNTLWMPRAAAARSEIPCRSACPVRRHDAEAGMCSSPAAARSRAPRRDCMVCGAKAALVAATDAHSTTRAAMAMHPGASRVAMRSMLLMKPRHTTCQLDSPTSLMPRASCILASNSATL
mmetsp:Transcript_22756/g.86221  ORF Transcript_22756/g.86221 Transcript_22756/m.86221 type:complete len:285 (-) Transcript_22756:133-987(-)